MSNKNAELSTTITSGGTDSAEIDLGSDRTLVGIYTPAVITGTAVSFKACDVSGGTFVSVRDGAGAAITKTVAASQYIPLDPVNFLGLRYIKVVSGSTEGADRIIKVVARVL